MEWAKNVCWPGIGDEPAVLCKHDLHVRSIMLMSTKAKITASDRHDRRKQGRGREGERKRRREEEGRKLTFGESKEITGTRIWHRR